MRDQTPMAIALPPRALRRNRLLLSLGVGVIVPALAIWSGTLLSHPRSAPMLVTLSEFAQSDSHEQPATVARVGSAPSAIRKPDHSAVLSKRSVVPLPMALMKAAIAGASNDEQGEVGTKPQAASRTSTSDDSNARWFNGRPIRPVRTMKMTVTAYSPDERSCGDSADGITASGYSVYTNGMKMAAADTKILPFGSLISVPGYDDNNVVPVLDRGGAIKGRRLDMLYPTHDQARAWGVQELTVTVWEYADGEPNDFKTQYRVASR